MSHNAAIVSLFMSNIDHKTVELQKKVVDKYNKSKYTHYHVLTNLDHGHSMDMVWAMNGINTSTFKDQNIEKKMDHDIIFFLDIDAVPLNDEAIDFFVEEAAKGKLIGNIQRSNHIQNDQHVFAAPSAVAMSADTYLTLDSPSAVPTRRADVGEEYTFAAEKKRVDTVLFLPLRFDAAPSECPSWALKDGMPVYGRGTVFGIPASIDEGKPEKPMVWHSFQIFHPGQQENFWKKCEEILNGKQV